MTDTEEKEYGLGYARDVPKSSVSVAVGAPSIYDNAKPISTVDLENLNPDLKERIALAQADWLANKELNPKGEALPITSGRRTREQQYKEYKARLSGATNTGFMAINPDEPQYKDKQFFHEDAVDMLPAVPDKFLANYGLHRPYGLKDPVHVQINPNFEWKNPNAKEEEQKYGLGYARPVAISANEELFPTTNPSSFAEDFRKSVSDMSWEDWKNKSLLGTAARYTGASVGLPGFTEEDKKPLEQKAIGFVEGVKTAVENPVETVKNVYKAVTEHPGTALGEMVKGAVYDPEMALLPGVKQTAQIVGKGAKKGYEIGKQGVGTAREALENRFEVLRPAEDLAGRNVGAAEVPAASLRKQRAAELPYPIDLEKSQLTRHPADVRFARETAKDPVFGQQFQEHYANQNGLIQRNLDQFVADTGATLTQAQPSTVGALLRSEVVAAKKAAKTGVDNAYKAARDAGQLSELVNATPLKNYVGTLEAEAINAPVITSAEIKLKNLINKEGGISLNDIEEIRKMVGRLSKDSAANAHYGKKINEIIDQVTDGKGGDLYKEARAKNTAYMNEFQDTPVMQTILNTKRGTKQHTTAVADLVDQVMMKGSAEDVTNLFNTLAKRGDSGQELINELRGAVAQRIKDHATKGVQRDINGKPYVETKSLDTIINQLDKSDKLDLLFGKKGAEQYRTINDVTKDVLTIPKDTTNPSGSSSSILAALGAMGAETATNAAISGGAFPVPIATGAALVGKHLYGRKVAKEKMNKISDFINYSKELP